MAAGHHHDVINENDNNNGPISPADLQNIENNNAGEYIPNLNQILVPVAEPVVVVQQQPFVNQFVMGPNSPSLPLVNAEIQAHSAPISPSSRQLPNDTNPFLDELPVQLNDIRIEMDEECYTEEPLLGSRMPMLNVKTVSGIQAMFQRTEPPAISETTGMFADDWMDTEMSSKNEQECSEKENVTATFSSDEAKNVEEALLALDFAISGAEAISDEESEDDSDAESSDQLASNSEQDLPNILPKPFTNTSEERDELIDEVLEVSTQLVDAVLEQSLDRVYEKLEQQQKESKDLASICDETAVVDSHDKDESGDDSLLDFDFAKLAMEASTPFVKHPPTNNTPFNDEPDVRPTRVAQNLFGTDNNQVKTIESNEDTWCAPLAADATFDAASKTVTTAAADATFDAASKTITIAAADTTFTPAANNATFTAEVVVDKTFTEPAPKLPQANLPEIRISPDSDIASVDLTTATPVNTPIELNYTVDGWDTFITNSMKKPVQSGLDEVSSSLHPNVVSAGPSGDATFPIDDASTSGWFLHPSENLDDVGSGWDDNEADDQCEDGALLSLTFDSLRKQLTEALPHAQGAMSCSATTELPEVSDDPDELMNNDSDLENR